VSQTIERVTPNYRKRAFEVEVASGILILPFAKVDPTPSAQDRVWRLDVRNPGYDASFAYELWSGKKGSVQLDAIFDDQEDPALLRRILHDRLMEHVQARLRRSPLSKREICRRLRTSPAQLYRTLHRRKGRKSVDPLLDLLAVLGCEVEVRVRERDDAD
jgi:hypothetical protein